MKKKKKTRVSIIISIAMSAPVAYLCKAAFYKGLVIKNYAIESAKLNKPIRIVLVADLHASMYGESQWELIEAIKMQKPDMVMMAGDIFVEYSPYDGAILFLEGVADLYPCYYVSGNHEYLTLEADEVKQMIRNYGVAVLEGDCKEVTVNGQQISIFGFDDPFVGETELNNQLHALSAMDTKSYSILLTHRPELVEEYKKNNYDLVLTGHSHGGQWRLPFILNGLYVPHQGLFPKYAGGQYKYNNTIQIVSRGMAINYRGPRIFNPPELVVVDIEPK